MTRRLLLFVACALPLAACGGNGTNPFTTPSPPPTGSAPYSVTDLRVGTGAVAVAGQAVTVTYTGWLYSDTEPEHKGTQFDAGTNTRFQLGTLIQGWNLGIPGMMVGGLRRLVVPPELGYGAAGRLPTIPRDATLLFEIELISVP
ncbi:MAG: FKBP-type peptidyl-prolyl cis-trans isomerase [Acidobacteriota bacterium]|nr:FKBP-type peptidyl-prolyl cis-trans isomerase [Acidobacteriota bacterium]